MAEFTASFWNPSPLNDFNTYMNVLFAGLWTSITQNSSQVEALSESEVCDWVLVS